jgi:hypothetical protein
MPFHPLGSAIAGGELKRTGALTHKMDGFAAFSKVLILAMDYSRRLWDP